MSRAEGLVLHRTSALVHALLTPATVAFVGALEKALREPAYHRPPGGEESGHDRSGLKDSCPFPLVHSAWELIPTATALPASWSGIFNTFSLWRLLWGWSCSALLPASSQAEVLSAVEADLLCFTLNQAEVCMNPPPQPLQMPQDHALWLLSSPTIWKTQSKQRHHSHPHSCTLCAHCGHREMPGVQLGLGFFCGASPESPEMSVSPESGKGVQQGKFSQRDNAFCDKWKELKEMG